MWCAVSLAAVAVLAGGACYQPFAPSGVPCNPTAPSCPTGQSCVPDGADFVCSAEPGAPDAPPGDVSSTLCFGTGLVKNLCLERAPVGMATYSGAFPIDTASVGGANCTSIVAQPGGPSFCVVARATIRVDAAATVRVTGPNPLLLIAADAIEVLGTIDASGHRDGIAGPSARTGCAGQVAGRDGQQGGGGGGAGGSFGTTGAAGGQGDGDTLGGTPGPAAPPTIVVGGCAGSRGGAGDGGGGAGPGGPGGGAIYAIAQRAIVVSGTISASGGGGKGGTGGANSGGAGGGGGSGGLIGLDAPQVSVTGRLLANGGGGGGGNGDEPTRNGTDGADPTVPAVAASGGAGGNGGGAQGGAGFAQGSPSKTGNGTQTLYCAGGGGGGGAGVIRVFQAPVPTGAAISPTPI